MILLIVRPRHTEHPTAEDDSEGYDAEAKAEAVRGQMLALADELRSFPPVMFGVLDDEDDEEEDGAIEFAVSPEDAKLAAGALVYATDILVDELFQDVQTCRRDDPVHEVLEPRVELLLPLRGERREGDQRCHCDIDQLLSHVLPGVRLALPDRVWPPGVTRFNSGSGTVSYVPVPALHGMKWPLFWYCPPSHSERFVHPAILRNAAASLFGHPMSFAEGESA